MIDMNRLARTLSLTLLWVCASAPAFAEPINAVIGDESWVQRHGDEPIEGEAGEVERIQTHLRHVVSGLRAGGGGALDVAQRAKRAWLLDELEAYAEAGVFPRRDAGDGHGVRRPRFIDAQGVHCAVGEMLRVSGREVLARRIDRDHEFDFVSQMDAPELSAWASEWGFSERELGMIQPGYSAPPSFEGAKHQVVSRAGAVVLECGKVARPDGYIKVRLEGGARGDVKTSLVRPQTEFAKCAVKMLQVRFGGAWNGSPEVFNRTLRVELPTREELLERRLERVRFEGTDTRCLPGQAPSPIPEKITLRAFTNALEHGVEVKTQPSYPEVEACIQRSVGKTLGLTKGEWKVDVTQTRNVKPLVRQAHTKQLLKSYAPNAATTCHGEGAPTKKLRVSVRITQEPQALTFDVSRGSDAFKACVTKELERGFVGSYTMSVPAGDGTWTRYVRYDADASASMSFVVETPEAREIRAKESREKMRREMDYR